MQVEAEKRGGVVDGPFINPSLRFFYRDQSVMVTIRHGRKNSPPVTRIVVSVKKAFPAKVILYHESIAARIEKKFGLQDIQLGVEDFDKAFIIQADNEFFVKNMMTPMIQGRLLEMKHQKPHIVFNEMMLTISMKRIFRAEEQYDQLINLAFALVDRASEL
jgi:hypothetical protein